MAEVLRINQGKVLAKQELPSFVVKVEDVPNPHKTQAFLDYGNEPGPWVTLGFNNTSYSLGYLPEDKKV